MAVRRSQDIQACGDFILMAFADGDLVPEEIDGIPADVVDLINIDNVRAMDLDEVGADQFLFHVLERAISDIVLRGRHEFHVIAHAFEKEDIVLL